MNALEAVEIIMEEEGIKMSELAYFLKENAHTVYQRIRVQKDITTGRLADTIHPLGYKLVLVPVKKTETNADGSIRQRKSFELSNSPREGADK